MVPLWIAPNQGAVLNPPAEVLAVTVDPKAPDRLAAAVAALHVTEAKRYQPSEIDGKRVTWCNIFTADVCQLLAAPLPHVFDLSDGKGKRELRANDVFDGLSANKFPGWAKTGTIASALAVKNLAMVGVPQVAVWKNLPGKPGHIVLVIPSRDARVWVAGAGGHCSSGCPIEDQFGKLPVTFFAFQG
jgi:hypothetical protein